MLSFLTDDRVAYTGSQNLVDPRFFKQESGVGEWVDAMVRITGPAAARPSTASSRSTGRSRPAPVRAAARPRAGDAVRRARRVSGRPSGPDLRPEAIHQLLLTAIYAARREL